jgi:hypothetical protein
MTAGSPRSANIRVINRRMSCFSPWLFCLTMPTRWASGTPLAAGDRSLGVSRATVVPDAQPNPKQENAPVT